jgi:hypothetical protein
LRAGPPSIIEKLDRGEARSGDFRKIEQARWRLMLINGNNSRISARLTEIGSKLRHDAVNDWVEDILR